MKKFLVLSLILVALYWGRQTIFRFTNSNEKESKEIVEVEKDREEPITNIPQNPPSPKIEDLPKTKSELPKADINIEELLEYVHEFEGSPYKAGGTNPSGFDCSGYIGYVYKEVGIQLPRSSAALAMYGKRIDYQDARPGDLLFFTGSNMGTGQIGHAGLVVEKDGDDVLMIHASSRGVVVDNVGKMDYFRDRYITATRPYEKK